MQIHLVLPAALLSPREPPILKNDKFNNAFSIFVKSQGKISVQEKCQINIKNIKRKELAIVLFCGKIISNLCQIVKRGNLQKVEYSRCLPLLTVVLFSTSTETFYALHSK